LLDITDNIIIDLSFYKVGLFIMINLDDIFPPALAPHNSNVKLNNSNRAKLDALVSAVEHENKPPFSDTIRELSVLMQPYNNPADRSSGGGMKYMPLELIQASYYIIYRYNVTEQKFLDELSINGINKNKKFFNKEIHVRDYKNLVEYEQPEMHINYLGQKKGILAEALKNIVFQSGSYDCFVDVFGGSGAATLAVPRRKEAVYVFNDKDIGLACLYDVISDDKDYEVLIKYIQGLKKDLRLEGEWNLLDELEKTIPDEINNYVGKKKRKSKVEKIILEHTNLSSGNKYWKSGSGYDYTDESQYRFYGYHCYFNNLLNNNNRLKQVWDGIEKQNNVYIEDKITVALAEIFIWTFTINGNRALSPILRMLLSEEQVYMYMDENNSWEQFLDKDFETPIRNIHKIIRKNYKAIPSGSNIVKSGKSIKQEQKSIIEVLDYSDLIQKYSNHNKYNKTLFYSDSPYLGTVGYSVGEWKNEDSKNLIDELVNSKKKFIFSCRACCFIRRNSNRDNEKIVEDNKKIYDNIIDYFHSKKIKLWAVCFSTQNLSFIEALEENKITEVMITNFELQKFHCKSVGVTEIMIYEKLWRIVRDHQKRK
jgi:hypothetical protein